MGFGLRRKPFITILLVLLFLIGGELLLQIRAHIRYGQSVFNAVKGETTYVTHPESGLKTLRPSSIIEGQQAVIESNSLGLRMPELPLSKPDDEVWIAVLGASTVMGAYTRSNERTLSARLEFYLQQESKERRVRVINAGIAGYVLKNQQKMLTYLLSKYPLDGVISYSGFNDIAGYCKSAEGDNQQKKNHALINIDAPKWLLTVDLITKNTVKLRDVPAGKSIEIDPATINTSVYEKSSKELYGQIARQVPHSLVGLNARSFRAHMPASQQASLSQTARYYLPCFSVSGLHQVYDTHNEILRATAANANIPVFDLMAHLPGGSEYFGDATHFSDKGTDVVAQLISRQISHWIIK